MSDEKNKKILQIKKTYAIQVVQALLGPVAAQALQTLCWGLAQGGHGKVNDGKHYAEDHQGRPCLAISKADFAKRISVKEDRIFKKPHGAIIELQALGLIYETSAYKPSMAWGIHERKIERFITAGLQLFALDKTKWLSWEEERRVAQEFSYEVQHGTRKGKRLSPFPTNDPNIIGPKYENLTPYGLNADDKKILDRNLRLLLFNGQKNAPSNAFKRGDSHPPRGGDSDPPYKNKGGDSDPTDGVILTPPNDKNAIRAQGKSGCLEHKEEYKIHKEHNKSSFSPCATLRTKNSVECSNNLYSGEEEDQDLNNSHEEDQDLSNRRNSDSGHTCRKNIFYESIHIAAKAMLDEVGDDKDHKKIQSIAADLEQVFAEYYVRPDCPFADAQDFLKQWALTVRRNRSSITALEHLEVDEDQKVWGRFQQRWM